MAAASAARAPRRLRELVFANSLTAKLPGDVIAQKEPAARLRSRQVRDACFSLAVTTPLRERPRLVAVSPAVAAMLDLEEAETQTSEFLRVFSGDLAPLEGLTVPWALRYAGHQFGQFAGQLGDGRAMSIGQVQTTSAGVLELQLKGCGVTPYSRGFDGRAVLRSSVREFLCSEAMHALGVPTTRALCLTASDDPVFRERRETAAVVCRVAPSFLRLGSFEVHFYEKEWPLLRALADYAIGEHFPTLLAEADCLVRYRLFLREVVERTAAMIAHWQAIGFCHGVMNTDNFSILGLTIDYGPFAFMEAFNPDFVCNHSDEGGLYSYSNQPRMALFNLALFGRALTGLGVAAEDAEAEVERFGALYGAKFVALMRRKLGLRSARDEDEDLIAELRGLMALGAPDYSVFFRSLGERFAVGGTAEEDDALFGALLPAKLQPRWRQWAERFRERLAAEASRDEERRAICNGANPKYILRTHLAAQAIERAERGDASTIHRLLRVLSRPFEEQADCEDLAQPPPPDAPRVCLSCSS